MNWTKLVKLIPISVTLLLMLFIMIILIQGVMNSSTAPYINVNDNSLAEGLLDNLSAASDASGSSGVASLSDSADSSGTDPALSKENASSNNKENAFTTVHMDKSDVNRGNLLLINHNNKYEIPDSNDLVSIAESKTKSYVVTDSVLLLSDTVIKPLNDMMDAFCDETGCDTVAIASAFRDYQRQQEILDYYVSIVGLDDAKKWAASPGHSEHHSGLSVDFGIFNDGVVKTFLRTGIYEWFFQNSDRYGFIPRYPGDKSDITKTANEPWHFRYVGLPHAYFIRQSGLCFEEYMEFIMDFTRGRPYCATFDGKAYEVYFTRDTDILVPADSEADISGNNIDGFIVTVVKDLT